MSLTVSKLYEVEMPKTTTSGLPLSPKAQEITAGFSKAVDFAKATDLVAGLGIGSKTWGEGPVAANHEFNKANQQSAGFNIG